MNFAAEQFLGIEEPFYDFSTAHVAILPFGYEGGVSYGHGTAQAPQAVIDASHYVEFYDEVLDYEPFRVGITTVEQPEIPAEPQAMINCIYEQVKNLLATDKFIITIGGDHSISSGPFKAMQEKFGTIGCIQFDAHSDLREEYEGSPLSHASVMARIREMTPHTCQFGIRSQCIEEVQLIKREKLSVHTMHAMRQPGFDAAKSLAALPEKIYLTIDVDAFDWSVVSSTGTPEPGGFTWDEMIHLLTLIFSTKTVVGVDVVELSATENDRNSPFAIAKLIYKIIGLKYHFI